MKTGIDTAKAFDVATYISRRDARDKATQRRDVAGSKAFEGIQIPGVLATEWRQFIQAGEGYLRKHAAAAYPAAHDACAHCQQPVTRAALDPVSKDLRFSNND